MYLILRFTTPVHWVFCCPVFKVSGLAGKPCCPSDVIRYIPYIFLLSIGAAWTAAAQVRIGGTVTDGQTETPLSGAHVFTEDMAHGAITNAEGRFVLELPALPDVIVVQYLGYAPRVFPVPPEESESLVIRLAPIVIPLEEVLVSGEDFASNLMEQVIRRKSSACSRTYHRFAWWARPGSCSKATNASPISAIPPSICCGFMATPTKRTAITIRTAQR